MSTALAIPSEMRTTLEDRRMEIADALPEWVTPDRFIITTLTAIGKNPDLQKCTQASMYLSIIECARIGLYPDNKEAALVPFGKEAILIPMVQGIIRLMLRSPGVLKVETRIVNDGDAFDVQYGLRPNLVHKPPIGGNNSDAPITHAYAIGWRQGTDPTFEVMTVEELEHVRSFSKAANSPAYKNYLGEMYRKIVLKRLAKYFDLSPEANRAIELDHAVIGDPEIEGSLDGPSDEYQNLVVKTHTAEGLERLKKEMSEDEAEGEDKEVEEVVENNEDKSEEQFDMTSDKRPYPAAVAREKIEELYDHELFKGRRRDEKRGENLSLETVVVMNLNKCFEGNPDPDRDRHSVLAYISRGESASIKDDFWTGAKLCVIEKWLDVKEWEGHGSGYTPRKESRQEAVDMRVTRMKEQGQQEMDV